MFIYRVRFDTKEDNRTYHWVTEVRAKNGRQAIAIVRERWHRRPHMFRLEAYRYVNPTWTVDESFMRIGGAS